MQMVTMESMWDQCFSNGAGSRDLQKHHNDNMLHLQFRGIEEFQGRIPLNRDG